jgi:hypothetical protein
MISTWVMHISPRKGSYWVTIDKSAVEHCLGRLGAFTNIIYAKSMIAKSPHVEPARVGSYDDYSPEFKDTLKAYLTRGMKRTKDLVDRLTSSRLLLSQFKHWLTL